MNLLLIDQEDALPPGQAGEQHPRWRHLRERVGDGWERPKQATDEHLYFMTMAVEAWLLHDVGALRAFYGNSLHDKGLPPANLESVPTKRLFELLRHATRDCGRRSYDKNHAFGIMLKMDPRHLRALPSGSRLLNGLQTWLRNA